MYLTKSKKSQIFCAEICGNSCCHNDRERLEKLVHPERNLSRAPTNDSLDLNSVCSVALKEREDDTAACVRNSRYLNGVKPKSFSFIEPDGASPVTPYVKQVNISYTFL